MRKMNWIDKIKLEWNIKKAEKKWDKYLIDTNPHTKRSICSFLGDKNCIYDDSLIDMLWDLSSEEHTNEKIGVHITGKEEWAQNIMREGLIITGHLSSGANNLDSPIEYNVSIVNESPHRSLRFLNLLAFTMNRHSATKE